MKRKICIFGLGYVGLPLVINFSKKFKVVGYDQDKSRIKELNRGIDRNNEIKKKQFNLKKNFFTTSIKDICNSDFFIIAVPTPINRNKFPDTNKIKQSLKIIGQVLKKKDIVVIESTVFPGFTKEIAVPILEKFSKLKFNHDFSCGYSPERINPGDKKHTLENIMKIVSGSDKKTIQQINDIYKSIITAGTYIAESIEVAEAAKVIENTQRDLNIALINELQMIFDKMKISTRQVLDAASTKWNFLNFEPGLVGGHCIGVDPYYLTYKSKKIGITPKVILSGRKINDKMGNYYVKKFLEFYKKNFFNKKKLNILVLGLTFKENCNDIRNSKVFDILNYLSKKNHNIDVFDPNIHKKQIFKKSKKINLITRIKIRNYDGIFLTVKHKEFYKLGLDKIKKFGKNKCIIYDIKNIFLKKENLTFV